MALIIIVQVLGATGLKKKYRIIALMLFLITLILMFIIINLLLQIYVHCLLLILHFALWYLFQFVCF